MFFFLSCSQNFPFYFSNKVYNYYWTLPKKAQASNFRTDFPQDEISAMKLLINSFYFYWLRTTSENGKSNESLCRVDSLVDKSSSYIYIFYSLQTSVKHKSLLHSDWNEMNIQLRASIMKWSVVKVSSSQIGKVFELLSISGYW